MDILLIWLMRAIGVVWIVAGAGILRQTWQIYRMEKLTDELDGLIEPDAAADAENRSGPQEDRQRNVWIGIGGVLTFQTGCALVAASGLSAPLSFILCVHQTAYVARQSKRSRHAAHEEDAADEAVSATTRNATLLAFLVSALAIYLTVSGVYG